MRVRNSSCPKESNHSRTAAGPDQWWLRSSRLITVDPTAAFVRATLRGAKAAQFGLPGGRFDFWPVAWNAGKSALRCAKAVNRRSAPMIRHGGTPGRSGAASQAQVPRQARSLRRVPSASAVAQPIGCPQAIGSRKAARRQWAKASQPAVGRRICALTASPPRARPEEFAQNHSVAAAVAMNVPRAVLPSARSTGSSVTWPAYGVLDHRRRIARTPAQASGGHRHHSVGRCGISDVPHSPGYPHGGGAAR